MPYPLNSSLLSRLKRIAETLFNYPKLYRAKFMITGILVKLLKPIAFQIYFTQQEILLSNIKPELSILELGCGDGDNFLALSESVEIKQFTGIDNNSEMIAFCQKRYPDQAWICMNSPPYPFPDKHFDSVIICNLLHHLDTIEVIDAVLKEALRLSKRVIIFEPLQSKNFLLRWAKKIYWLLSDGGNIYMNTDEFQATFSRVRANTVWVRESAPLNHFFACEITAKD